MGDQSREPARTRERESSYAKTGRNIAESLTKGIQRSARRDRVTRVTTSKQENLSNSKVIGAHARFMEGESIRSLAAELDVSHVALSKRFRAIQKPLAEFGQFCLTDVQIIMSVADGGYPGVLTELARYMECSLIDLVEVTKEFGGRHGAK